MSTNVADETCILGTNCKDDIAVLFALSTSAFAVLVAVAVVLGYRTFWSRRTKSEELALVPIRSGPVVSLAVHGEMELGGSSGSGAVGMAFSPRIAAL